MTEVLFPLSLRSFSPLWRWSSVGNDSSQGWTVLCAEKVALYRCDDQAAQYTTAAASANLTFYGTAISVYANATGGMNWAMAIDGRDVRNSSSTSGSPDVLASWTGLSSQQHVLTLTTDPGGSGAAFTLDRADVIVGTGQSGKNVSTSYVDSENPAITYSPGFWHDYGGYPNTFIPPGANNNNFTGSNTPGDKASFVFNASAIVWYGPCYLACGPYSVSIDSELATVYNGTWDTPTAVAEGCVRFLRSDLHPTKQHAITISVIGKGYVNIDYFQLFAVPGGATITGGSTPSSTSSVSPSETSIQPSSSSHHSNSNVGAIAGGVASGVGAAVIGLVLFFLWRRRKYRKDKTITSLPLSSEKPLDGEDGNAGAAIIYAGHTGSFPPDSRRAGAPAHRSGSKASRINTDPVLLHRRDAIQTDDTASPGSEGVRNAVQQPSSIPTTSQTHFNPALFDYRPPEKAPTNSGPSALPSSHVLESASRPEAGVPAAPSPGNLPRATEGEPYDQTPIFSLYPTGSVSDESSRRGLVPPPQQRVPAAEPQNITLTQLSQDVNRILTHLGRLRITPGEPVEDEGFDHQAHPIHDPVFDDETNPPEYGEYQHHHEGEAAAAAEVAAIIRAPLPPIPPSDPP